MFRRRLFQHGYQLQTPGRLSFHKRNHRTAKVAYAHLHVHWPPRQFENILFTDESRINPYSSDRHPRVHRLPNKLYAACNFQGEMPYGGESVIFWEEISLNTRADLHILRERSLIEARYITNILQPYVYLMYFTSVRDHLYA